MYIIYLRFMLHILWFQALKALALVRLNKKREGLALLENIKETAQCLDETTLQAMAMSYKESDKSKFF